MRGYNKYRALKAPRKIAGENLRGKIFPENPGEKFREKTAAEKSHRKIAA